MHLRCNFYLQEIQRAFRVQACRAADQPSFQVQWAAFVVHLLVVAVRNIVRISIT